jgi:hypothetical protein
MEVYIINLRGHHVWKKAFRTFEEALVEVKKAIDGHNDLYKMSPNYVEGDFLPGSMYDEYEMGKVASLEGTPVAIIEDEKYIFFVQKLTL